MKDFILNIDSWVPGDKNTPRFAPAQEEAGAAAILDSRYKNRE